MVGYNPLLGSILIVFLGNRVKWSSCADGFVDTVCSSMGFFSSGTTYLNHLALDRIGSLNLANQTDDVFCVVSNFVIRTFHGTRTHGVNFVLNISRKGVFGNPNTIVGNL